MGSSPLKKAWIMPALMVAITLISCSSPTSNQSQTPNSTVQEVNAPQENPSPETTHGSAMLHGSSMDLGPADAEYDLRFIDAMILHHQGAVDMAKEALEKSNRPEMQKLARDIIAAQEREIQAMKQWRQGWYPKAGSKPIAYHASMGHSMEMSPEMMQSMMMAGDLGPADAEFDLRFIEMMIPHHEGALVMAKDADAKSKRPEILKLAQDILSSQQAEIDQMKQWRKAWYNK